MEEQLNKEQAQELYDNGAWKKWTPEQIVKYQLFQERLFVPFAKFHEAMEKVLNRPIYTHEFAYPEELIKEYLKEKLAPTFEEILNLIPQNKQLLVMEIKNE